MALLQTDDHEDARRHVIPPFYLRRGPDHGPSQPGSSHFGHLGFDLPGLPGPVPTGSSVGVGGSGRRRRRGVRVERP